jgi:hypothetical protein
MYTPDPFPPSRIELYRREPLRPHASRAIFGQKPNFTIASKPLQFPAHRIRKAAFFRFSER